MSGIVDFITVASKASDRRGEVPSHSLPLAFTSPNFLSMGTLFLLLISDDDRLPPSGDASHMLPGDPHCWIELFAFAHLRIQLKISIDLKKIGRIVLSIKNIYHWQPDVS